MLLYKSTEVAPCPSKGGVVKFWGIRFPFGWGRRGLSFLFLLLFPLLFPAVSLGQNEFHREYTKEHPLVYEDAWDLWPYVFLDDEGEPAGYNVDLLKMIFEELEIPYVIILKPTSQALEDLRLGRSDLMLGMVAGFHDDYTTHYGKNVIQLFTHSLAHPKDQPPKVHNVSDLANHQVIVHDGAFSHHLMQDHGWGDNAIAHGDMDKAVQLVSSENDGQILWNTMSLKWLIHKYQADNLMLSPVDMPSGDYRFMANDKQLLDLLDNTFTKLKATDRLQPLEKKWFYPEEGEHKTVPKWLWYVVIAAGFIALSFFIGSLFTHLRERKVTKETRVRNARLALILNTSQVKMWTYDVRRRIFTRYDAATREKHNFTVQEFSKRYHPDDFDDLMDNLTLITSKERDEIEFKMNVMDGPNGEERSYIIRLSVLRYDKGWPSVIIGTKNDVTEDDKKLQKDLELMARYQSVFDTAMVDMVAYDKEGYITQMNERAQNTFMMNIDAVLAEHVKLSDILRKEDFDIEDFHSTDYFYATLFLDYSKEKHLDSRKREGKIEYDLQLVPVYDESGEMLGAYGTGREISEMVSTYRQAKEGVKQLKKALDEVKEHVDNINYALQAGGVRMVSYSPKTHQLSIYHRMHEAQYVLTQQRCIELAYHKSVNTVMRMFRMMDRQKDAIMDCGITTNLRLPSGMLLCLQMHLFPVHGADGSIVEYAGICRDTTEMKFTEHRLQLETEKAQEIEQVKNQFLHNMCFEIRTPLNNVVGFAEMFEKEHAPKDEEMFIKEIKDNTSYLLNLINDILFLSRLDARMVEIKPELTDFAQTFEGRCHQGWAGKEQPGVNFVIENPYDQLVVNIDDGYVGRAIGLVAENAAQHTSHGTVRARYDYIGGRLVIVISDTGEGIAPEKLEHIFERFNASSGQSQNTGLGLPICKELVSQMGGTIEISSEVNKGTSVWISIPCEASVVEHKTEN